MTNTKRDGHVGQSDSKHASTSHGQKSNATSSTHNKGQSGHAEAGRKGGLAPHECRGSECDKSKTSSTKREE